MDLRKLSCLLALFFITLTASAKVELKVTYTDDTGSEVTETENFTAKMMLFANALVVPAEREEFLRRVLRIFVLMPKSVMAKDPLSVRRMLSGLISWWTTSILCRYARPEATSPMNCHRVSGSHSPMRERAEDGQYGMTRKGRRSQTSKW